MDHSSPSKGHTVFVVSSDVFLFAGIVGDVVKLVAAVFALATHVPHAPRRIAELSLQYYAQGEMSMALMKLFRRPLTLPLSPAIAGSVML